MTTPLYESMCSAIADCRRVDEAEAITDPSLRIAAYVRQARNLTPERQAAEVRLRAERQIGRLLKKMAMEARV